MSARRSPRWNRWPSRRAIGRTSSLRQRSCDAKASLVPEIRDFDVYMDKLTGVCVQSIASARRRVGRAHEADPPLVVLLDG